jgi:hypothetical protein
MPGALPSTFASTRDSLHALAEHVIAPARFYRDRHIMLTPTPGGFGTPLMSNGERVRVEGVELLHERPGSTKRVPITTLADAAAFIGIPLGSPEGLYKAATPCLPDAPLQVEAEAAHALADWFALAAAVLKEVHDAYAATNPSGIHLWPEHFDIGCDLGVEANDTRANYGASPGDGTIADPYLYVGPWAPERRTGVFAMYPFGAARSYDELLASGDLRSAAAEFFFDGAALLLGAP